MKAEATFCILYMVTFCVLFLQVAVGFVQTGQKGDTVGTVRP